MYVWARMARMIATASSRGPYVMGGESRLAFRCLPTDIDYNVHLNNARYMMLADLGRIDIFLRSGLLRLARKKAWAPMMGGLQSVYVREIRLWRCFEVVSSIESWEGTQVIGKHRFVLDSGETAALIMTNAGIYDRANRRFVDMGEVVAALETSVQPRPLTEPERLFMTSHRRLRDLAKAGD
ncbi:thioesterase family protein [Mesorhizobium sp. INR15]|uniref:thioesterase family protein n=1 Tax=Mesorhizobium sp. INR15 TaxID=2654248 RepID=UPI00189692A6|nr:thioesterase family protein [Mesorhizobium sp. INR15]QPC94912.1 thioesterase [Mesorhizobium sp. INR15]